MIPPRGKPKWQVLELAVYRIRNQLFIARFTSDQQRWRQTTCCARNPPHCHRPAGRLRPRLASGGCPCCPGLISALFDEPCSTRSCQGRPDPRRAYTISSHSPSSQVVPRPDCTPPSSPSYVHTCLLSRSFPFFEVSLSWPHLWQPWQAMSCRSRNRRPGRYRQILRPPCPPARP